MNELILKKDICIASIVRSEKNNFVGIYSTIGYINNGTFISLNGETYNIYNPNVKLEEGKVVARCTSVFPEDNYKITKLDAYEIIRQKEEERERGSLEHDFFDIYHGSSEVPGRQKS